MSVVPVILFVLALFALIALVALGAVLQATFAPRTTAALAYRAETSRELAGQHAA